MSTTKMVEAYPLQWPVGWPRWQGERPRARFGRRDRTDRGYSVSRQVTIADGVLRLREQLDMLGAEQQVISTNVPTRRDGLPLSRVSEPKDPGAAVYFVLQGQAVAFATDKWDRLADNLAALAAHIEAMRGQERWGVGSVKQAFAGYKALAAMDARKPWWEVLGLRTRPTKAEHVRDRFHELAQQHHPDRGGNGNQMAEITAAYSEGMRDMGATT